jgi:hypothetical protein
MFLGEWFKFPVLLHTTAAILKSWCVYPYGNRSILPWIALSPRLSAFPLKTVIHGCYFHSESTENELHINNSIHADLTPDEVTGVFNCSNSSSRTMSLRSTQPLREISTMIFLGLITIGTQNWQPHRHLWADFQENVRTSTSHNRVGFHGLLQG